MSRIKRWPAVQVTALLAASALLVTAGLAASVASPLMPLTASKTATATFDRTITWELSKSVAPTTHGGLVGDAFTSTWEVTATKTVVEDNFKVIGTITVANPNHVAVSVEVDDVLDDGTVATVTCPDTDDNTGMVPANDELVCSYTASPDDASATSNTAEITSLTDDVEGATATAKIEWTPNVIGDEETLLEDPRFDFSRLISESTTETFTEQFGCLAEGTFTHVNTAALSGDNTDLTASATVTVSCDDIQRPSISVQQVSILGASKGGSTVSGWFVIKNMSGGEATRVTLNQVSVSFVARSPGGVATSHSASCSFTPNPNGYTLQPHEAKQFSCTCTISPVVPGEATELTARVTVGTATNQLGEVRGPWSATSPSFRFP